MKKNEQISPEEEMVELLRNILIVQLGIAKVSQNEIRKIAGCSINRVNDLLKHIPKIKSIATSEVLHGQRTKR